MGKIASTSRPPTKKGKASGLRKLIRENQSSDEDEAIANSTTAAITNPSRPWYADFKNYIDAIESKPPAGMSTIQWWGVSISD
jgi:hypothetical protein